MHAAELGYWFSAQAARLRAELGFRLVLTVWETLPFADAYRNVRTRRYRRETLAAADLFLATTERARDALLLEGAPAEPDPGRAAGDRRRALRGRALGLAAGRTAGTSCSRSGGWCGRRATRTCCARSRCCASAAATTCAR